MRLVINDLDRLDKHHSLDCPLMQHFCGVCAHTSLQLHITEFPVPYANGKGNKIIPQYLFTFCRGHFPTDDVDYDDARGY